MAIVLITLSQLNNNAYVSSFPILAIDFSTTYENIKLSLVLSTVFFGLSQLVYGFLSDKYGRRIVAISGLSIFMIATLSAAMAKQIDFFLLARIFQGIGIGCAGPVASAMTRDIASGKELTKMFSYISLAIFITPVAGPLLGSYLQHYIGWQAIFYFIFLYTMIIWLLFIIKFLETNNKLSTMSFSLIGVRAHYLTIFKNKNFNRHLLMLIFLYTGELIYLMQLPILMQVHLGYTVLANGWIMIFTAAGMFTGSFLCSRLVDKMYKEKIFTLGTTLILCASVTMFSFSILKIFNIYVLVGPMMIYMVGSGMLFPNCIAGCLEPFTNSHGVASALMSGTLMFSAALLSLFAVFLPTNNQIILASCLICTAACFSFICYNHMKSRIENINIDYKLS